MAYVFDPDHTFVTFEVLHFGTSTLRGRFGAIDGFVQLDRDAGKGSLSLRLRTASVDTGMPFFDARLRQGDLLASDAEPVAYFVASSFSFDGPAVRAVRGELTWRGVSQALELRATRFGCHTHPCCSAKSAVATSKANSNGVTSAPASACPSSKTACDSRCRSKAFASSAVGHRIAPAAPMPWRDVHTPRPANGLQRHSITRRLDKPVLSCTGHPQVR